MKSNYRKLGEFIVLVNKLNTDLNYGESDVRGISNNKEIIQTKADNRGRDLSNFYVVAPNEFIYNSRTSRMGDKVGLGYNDSAKTFITSFNNTVFRVKKEELLPMYLFMWFSRPEFDRYARYHSWGSSTEIFPWDDMCHVELPIPSLEKQKESVAEYNTIVNRIKLNEELNRKLEETAQAIYKRWFVEGVDVENLPEGWTIANLTNIATYLNGLAMQKFPAETEKYLPVLKIRELTQGYFDTNSDKGSVNTPIEYVIASGDVIFSWSGTLKVDIWSGGKGALNQHLFKVYSKKYPKWFYYLWTKFYLTEFIRIAEGKATSLGHIKREHLVEAEVLIPTKNELEKMTRLMKPIINNLELKKLENQKLTELKELLLSKLAAVVSSE